MNITFDLKMNVILLVCFNNVSVNKLMRNLDDSFCSKLEPIDRDISTMAVCKQDETTR